MSAHWDAFRFSEKKHTLEYIYFECTYWYGFNETSSFLFLPLDVEMLNLESLKRCTCTTLFPFCSAPLRRHLFHFFPVLLGTGVWWRLQLVCCPRGPGTALHRGNYADS